MRLLKSFGLMLLLTFSSHATEVQASRSSDQTKTNKLILSYCSHYGSGVSFSFQSCVNSNFSRVARVMGNIASYCSNFGDEVSFSFTSCVNRNFQNTQSRANGSLYLQYCSNFDRSSLGFGYVSCVNSNFRSIERYVAAQESDQ